MFSGSNSYLGGQSGRPGGQQQYNQFQPPQQAQQPQQSFLNPNPTGYGQPPVQPNFTGYPLQGQPTGYNPQQVQQQQTGFPGQQNPSAFGNVQAPQQQSFQTGAPPMPQIPNLARKGSTTRFILAINRARNDFKQGPLPAGNPS